jgi:chemotaxis protein CheD
MDYVIGIGEYLVIKGDGNRLITYALASCVAVIIYFEDMKIAGMIHIALPEAINSYNFENKPGYYAEIGLPILLTKLRNSYQCDLSKGKVFLIGGANSVKEYDHFKVGERNIAKIKSILNEYNIKYNSDEVGGTVSRTVILEAGTGNIAIDYHDIVI